MLQAMQNANFYLPVLPEYFPFLLFIPKESCCIFIFSSFITLPLHQDIFLSINEQVRDFA